QQTASRLQKIILAELGRFCTYAFACAELLARVTRSDPLRRLNSSARLVRFALGRRLSSAAADTASIHPVGDEANLLVVQQGREMAQIWHHEQLRIGFAMDHLSRRRLQQKIGIGSAKEQGRAFYLIP